MLIKSFISKGVLSELCNNVTDLTTTEKIKLFTDYCRLIEFVNDCDDYFILDLEWLDKKGPLNDYILHLLAHQGTNTNHFPDKNSFEVLLSTSEPFTIHFCKDKIGDLSNCPTLNPKETYSLLKRSSKRVFAITDKHKRDLEFKSADFKHSPKNILISDRHFFSSPNPIIVFKKLLSNFIDTNFKSKITVTILYSEEPGFGYKIESLINKINEEVKSIFPNLFLYLEPIKLPRVFGTHDRFVVTDILFYTAGNSFTFLDPTSNIETILNRTLLIDSKNFRDNLKLMKKLLLTIKTNSEILLSRNQIIKNFLYQNA